jgi:two-component system response regulator FlrC
MARLLVVDDDDGVRSYLVDALSLDGHSALAARGGAEAIAALQRESFEVVLTDLKMPGVDGMAVLAAAAEHAPDAPVIVLTAHGSVDSAVSAMKAGAFDFLQKPIQGPKVLRGLVRAALEAHTLRRRAEQAPSTESPLLSWGDPTMGSVVQALDRVAATEATVLLQGESGVGKEVAARAIHARSRRSSGLFVAVNCAALSDTLLESELFGHEKGAFTGAAARKRGKLELASGGTFFLDEVGELRPDLQARLLRVLQERRFERVGGVQTVMADVRWVAATNRDLRAQVAAGSFREDLYYRLAVFPLTLPPLRARPLDLPYLAEVLLQRAARELGRPGLRLSPAASRAIASYPWPGNARELGNALERAAILSDGLVIGPEHLPQAEPDRSGPIGGINAPEGTLDAMERAAVQAALSAEGGHRRRAAERLGIAERTLYDKLKRHGLG